MKFLLFFLAHIGWADLLVPEDFQFQEYIETAQPALEFSESSPRVNNFEFSVTTPDDGSNPFELKPPQAQAGGLVGHLQIRPGVTLDRELVPEYKVTIRSIDASGAIINERQVTIRVSDTNDNKPHIKPESLRMEVLETAKPNDIINRVIATDADIGKFAQLEFSMVSQVALFKPRNGGNMDYNPAFGIHKNGDVYLASTYNKDLLDSEKYEYATFTISVRDDPDNPGASAHSTGEVKVFIKDVNDNAPIFTMTEMTGSVSEAAEIGSVVDIEISATDADVDSANNKIGYKVLGNAPFEFNGDQLVVSGKLDYESQDEYQIKILAYNPDSGSETPSTDTVITIKITDANEPPQCNPYSGTRTPVENDGGLNGQVVGNMDCNDGDSGFETLTFSLSDEAGFFSINPVTGAITLEATPDREWSAKAHPIEEYVNNGKHTVTITVTDDGKPKGMALVKEIGIPIADEPDEPPVFSAGPLRICGDPQHLSSVANFTLVDPDKDGSIDSVNAHGVDGFTVARLSGHLWHLSYSGVLENFSGQLDKLSVTATGNDGRTATKEFDVMVCSCTNGQIDVDACGLGGSTTNEATFPLWIIILIIALVVGILLIATIVVVKKNRNKKQQDFIADGEDDQQHLFSKDTEGAPAGNGIYDPNMTMTLNGRGNSQPHWAKPRPDGDLGDIINQCKDAADKEEIVPNALLEYNFEGTNSIISDLSSLASWTGQSEKDLELDTLPDATQKFFRQHP